MTWPKDYSIWPIIAKELNRTVFFYYYRTIAFAFLKQVWDQGFLWFNTRHSLCKYNWLHIPFITHLFGKKNRIPGIRPALLPQRTNSTYRFSRMTHFPKQTNPFHHRIKIIIIKKNLDDRLEGSHPATSLLPPQTKQPPVLRNLLFFEPQQRNRSSLLC